MKRIKLKQQIVEERKTVGERILKMSFADKSDNQNDKLTFYITFIQWPENVNERLLESSTVFTSINRCCIEVDVKFTKQSEYLMFNNLLFSRNSFLIVYKDIAFYSIKYHFS